MLDALKERDYRSCVGSCGKDGSPLIKKNGHGVGVNSLYDSVPGWLKPESEQPCPIKLKLILINININSI